MQEQAIRDLRTFITTMANVPAVSDSSVEKQLANVQRLQEAVDGEAAAETPVVLINRAWQAAMEWRVEVAHKWVIVEALERKARFELDEDDYSWSKARSGDIRKHLIEVYYGDSEHYAEARANYEEAKLNLRVALMDVQRVKMLVDSGHL